MRIYFVAGSALVAREIGVQGAASKIGKQPAGLRWRK